MARATLGHDPRVDAAPASAGPARARHADRTVPISDMGLLLGAREAAGRTTADVRVPGVGHFLEVDGRVPTGMLDAVAAFADEVWRGASISVTVAQAPCPPQREQHGAPGERRLDTQPLGHRPGEGRPMAIGPITDSW